MYAIKEDGLNYSINPPDNNGGSAIEKPYYEQPFPGGTYVGGGAGVPEGPIQTITPPDGLRDVVSIDDNIDDDRDLADREPIDTPAPVQTMEDEDNPAPVQKSSTKSIILFIGISLLVALLVIYLLKKNQQ